MLNLRIRARKLRGHGRLIALSFLAVMAFASNPMVVRYWYPNVDDSAAFELRRSGFEVRRTSRLPVLSTLAQAEFYPYGEIWEINARNIRFSQRQAEYLTQLRSLEMLSISSCQIDDRCGSIGPPSENRLKIVFLRNSNIRDQNIDFLRNSRNLWFLAVENTELSERSIEVILSCKKLSCIELRGNKFTPEGIRRLREGFPKAKIVVIQVGLD